MERLWNFEIVFFRSQEGMPWWTSTNPVVVHNRTASLEFFGKDSEVYFPLSPKYTAYLHYGKAGDRENILRGFASNKIHDIDEELNTDLQHIILMNPAEYIIFAGRADIARGDLK